MATARELLAQADALMRRNRPPGAEGPAREIPVLTEIVGPGEGQPQVPPAPTQTEPWLGAAAQAAAPRASAPAAEIPLLTDIVEDIAPLATGSPTPGAPTLDWPAFDEREASVDDEDHIAGSTAPAALPPDEDTELRSAAQDESPPAEAPPASAESVGGDAETVNTALAEGEAARSADGASSTPGLPAAPDRDAARWDALAEEVRMQVLQRIDIFTDTGLHEQLAERLQPIVDHASADLVATINQQVGQLLRSYVAEAIEREIDKWRHEGEP